uniref:Uncharacterized protein n=1 Tax=Caenorhabditis japonica TaxID=281687 RepID=A0A8R1I388_CAEJA
MTDWMVPLILIYSIMLSHDIQEEFHLRCFRINRDTLIWIAMIFYGCLFNSFNPWDNITIRRIHHVNGHISTSFNVIDALLMAISVLLVSLHGYRMSLANALRDNRFHITLLFILIKTVIKIGKEGVRIIRHSSDHVEVAVIKDYCPGF